MARIVRPKCRICRRAGTKLFLKGYRCFTKKCAMERRPRPPGHSGRRRARLSDYGAHLRELQRVKKMYGLTLRPFQRIFAEAQRMPGDTGDNLVLLLERRLDNVLMRLSMALSRSQARQWIVHGHVRVNGRRVRSPGYLVAAGDVIEPDAKDRSRNMVKAVIPQAQEVNSVPSWLRLDAENLRGTVLSLPKREDVSVPFDPLLVVEFMSI